MPNCKKIGLEEKDLSFCYLFPNHLNLFEPYIIPNKLREYTVHFGYFDSAKPTLLIFIYC